MFDRFVKRLVSRLSKAMTRISRSSLLRAGVRAFTGRRRQRTVLVALVALVTVASSLFLFNSILGEMVFRRSFDSYGKVKAFGVGIYWDDIGTQPVYSFNWGLVEPGLVTNVPFYVSNEGNFGVTLSLDTENWNPANASEYLTLKWDYVGQLIDPGETVPVTLSLLVSTDTEAITDFAFDVIITGSG